MTYDASLLVGWVRFVAQLDPAVAEGVDDRLGAVVDRQLAQDRRDVVLHGLVTDIEQAGDLLVAVAPGNAVKDLHLTRRQRREDTAGDLVDLRQFTELIEYPRGDEWARQHVLVDEVFPARHPANHGDQFGRVNVLRAVG